MPYCSKLLLTCLTGLLLISCSGGPVRTDSTATAEEKSAEKLPRDYDNALTLMQSGNYLAAIPVLMDFIQEQPNHAGPYINLAIALRQEGDPEATQAALSRAIEINPSSAPAYHQLGILQREQGDFKAALDAYKKALELNPDYELAHRNIGILYDIYLLQPELALQHYRRFLELEGGNDVDVKRWVIDLERRSNATQTSTAT